VIACANRFMTNPIFLHITYAEPDLTIREACALAAEHGFDGVEFRRTPRAAAQIFPTTGEYLDEIARSMEEFGLTEVAFGMPGPDLVGSQSERERDQWVAFAVEASERLSITAFNLLCGGVIIPGVPHTEIHGHGGYVASEHVWDQVASHLRVIGSELARLGIPAGIENHSLYLHDSLEHAKRLVDSADSEMIGLTLDYANAKAFRGCCPVEDLARELRQPPVLLHLKNSLAVGRATEIRCGLGDGEINHRVLLQQMIQLDFQGPIVLEAPRQGDRTWFVRSDKSYLDFVLESLASTAFADP